MAEFIEWAPFGIKPEVAEMSLLVAAELMQTQFLQGQKGYLQRDLMKSPCGQYVDLIRWSSESAAHKALMLAQSNPSCLRYFDLMVKATTMKTEMSHFQVISRYPEKTSDSKFAPLQPLKSSKGINDLAASNPKPL